MKEKAFEYIDALAAKLGVAAEHVYGVLIRQKIAEGVADLILGSALLAIFIFLLVVLFGILTKAEYSEDWGKAPLNIYAKMRDTIEESDGMLYLPYGFIQLIIAIISIICLYSGTLSVINPEYYAIKEILEVIGGGK